MAQSCAILEKIEMPGAWKWTKKALVNSQEIPESLVSYSKDRLDLDLSGWKGRQLEVLIKF